jgi:hypothetical protein
MQGVLNIQRKPPNVITFRNPIYYSLLHRKTVIVITFGLAKKDNIQWLLLFFDTGSGEIAAFRVVSKF